MDLDRTASPEGDPALMACPLPEPEAEPTAQLTPHRAESVRLASEHGPLAALAAVPASATATVVLVPGYTGSKEDFAPLLDPIAEAGLAVVALDLPGQHESPGPDDEAEYLPSRLGQVLAAVMAELAPQPVIVLGHSYGGLVCRAAVLAGARVAGLVLLCSGPGELPAGGRRTMLDAAEPVLRNQGVAALQKFREAIDNTWRAVPRPDDLAALLRQRFLNSSPSGLLGMAAGLRGEPDRVDELALLLRRTGTPSLVLCGQGDDAWHPAAQRDMAERLDAPFVTVPDSAHSPAVENPDALLEVLLTTWQTWLDRGR